MNYTIDKDAIQAVVSSASGRQYSLTAEEVELFCTADWPEGQEHQDWLDTATPEEIADWVIAGRR